MTFKSMLSEWKEKLLWKGHLIRIVTCYSVDMQLIRLRRLCSDLFFTWTASPKSSLDFSYLSNNWESELERKNFCATGVSDCSYQCEREPPIARLDSGGIVFSQLPSSYLHTNTHARSTRCTVRIFKPYKRQSVSRRWRRSESAQKDWSYTGNVFMLLPNRFRLNVPRSGEPC